MNENSENNTISMGADKFDEKELNVLKKLLDRLMKSYAEKKENVTSEQWLQEVLKKEIPNMSEDVAKQTVSELSENLNEYEKNYEDLNQACEQGIEKEKWFAKHCEKMATGMSVAAYGEHLKAVNSTIADANSQLWDMLHTQNFQINQNPNLDGFIAEQQHVHSFNMRAILQNSPYRAEVCGNIGEGFAKNSFDMVIKDSQTDKIVHQYQCKYGADAQATIQMIKTGNYNNQILVVPKGQVAEVQAAFPGKTVVSTIGDTDRIGVTSSPLTKEEAKQLQTKVQEDHAEIGYGWNSYSAKELAFQLGKNAAITGLISTVIASGLKFTASKIKGEKIDAEEFFEDIFKTFLDGAGKYIVMALLMILIASKFPAIPVGLFAILASVIVENLKILWGYAKGEITLTQAMDQMGRTTTTLVFSLTFGSIGMQFGALALSWIPVAGPIIGSFVGGLAFSVAGYQLGNKIYNGLKKIANNIKTAVQSFMQNTPATKVHVNNSQTKVYNT